jgi:ProQ/FINO family
MPEYRSDHVAKSPLTMPDRARKTLHLPAKPAAQPAEEAAPAKPRISPEEQRAREAADQEAKRIRLAALSKDAEALKISLIDRYPHLFAVDPPRPLASGIHRVLAEQTGAPMPVLKLALAKLTRRNAYLAALGAGGPRYDIDGRTSGMISPDDQQAAVEALQRRLVRSPQAVARRKERKIAAAARS